MSHNKHNYNPNNKDPKAAADTEKAKEQQQAAQEAASDLSLIHISEPTRP